MLYMPTTLPRTSPSRRRSGSSSAQDRVLRVVPRGEDRLRQDRPRRDGDRSGAALDGRDDRPAPAHGGVAEVRVERWYSSWAPGFLKPVLGVAWPERRRRPGTSSSRKLNAAMQLPGWTNAWTMPIKARIDMLSTGVRTPVGIKVFGTSIPAIEKVGVTLEKVIAPHRRHAQRPLRAIARRHLRRHRPAARGARALRPHHRRREPRRRGGHRRRAHQRHRRGAEAVHRERALPPGLPLRPGAAPPGARAARRVEGREGRDGRGGRAAARRAARADGHGRRGQRAGGAPADRVRRPGPRLDRARRRPVGAHRRGRGGEGPRVRDPRRARRRPHRVEDRRWCATRRAPRRLRLRRHRRRPAGRRRLRGRGEGGGRGARRRTARSRCLRATCSSGPASTSCSRRCASG